ncbi:hypothetical protein PQV03_09885 [Thermoanaerobacterium thermosaccharolyticum]|uniref:hypothetical protein n=1 Tax=Thermoanaerobacterium thermosaccharolyticum TaxID=1517 RepID=UPI003D2A66E2
MKIHFKCYKCGEEFNVEAKNLVKKQSLECPNCGNNFDVSALDKLRNAVQNIEDAKSILQTPVPSNVIATRRFYSWEFTFIEED